MSLTIISIALMVVGLVGIIVCQKKQKTNPNAQALAFVFLIVILAGADVMIYDTFTGDDRLAAQMQANELTYRKSTSNAIAEYAGKSWNGAKVVIITKPKVDGTDKTFIETLQADLKNAGLNVAAVEALNVPQPANPEEVPEMEFVDAKYFNEIFNKYNDAAIFVITASLPQDKQLGELKCWKGFDPKKQCIILTDAESLDRKVAKAGFHKGVLAALVATNPKYQPTEEVKAAPSDPKAAFAERYILITKDNYKENDGFFAQ